MKLNKGFQLIGITAVDEAGHYDEGSDLSALKKKRPPFQKADTARTLEGQDLILSMLSSLG